MKFIQVTSSACFMLHYIYSCVCFNRIRIASFCCVCVCVGCFREITSLNGVRVPHFQNASEQKTKKDLLNFTKPNPHGVRYRSIFILIHSNKTRKKNY